MADWVVNMGGLGVPPPANTLENCRAEDVEEE